MFRARRFASAALTACLVTVGGIGATVLPAGAAQAASCTSSDIASALRQLTSTTAHLNTQLVSAPGNVRSASQTTTDDLKLLASGFYSDAGALSSCAPLSDADAGQVVSALNTLTSVTDRMLNTLIRDYATFAEYGRTAPITIALHGFEGGFDFYLSALPDVAPTRRGAIKNDQTSIDTSLGNAISAYEKTCLLTICLPA